MRIAYALLGIGFVILFGVGYYLLEKAGAEGALRTNVQVDLALPE